MINSSELNAVKLSPTKKDFYQIWNELLETAGKISERWDPTSTNESDPGIVLLKVLTAVADKLNYQIDENILEDYMPSAAQQESMRKLTEMLGYTMKYYQSATTDVTITYNKSLESPINGTIYIDKFTNIKDIDSTINYVTLEQVYLNQDSNMRIIPCMEGELVECETDNDNIVSISQLDDNNRYYLPETQIAENGIFVTNIDDGIETQPWEKVSNLNTQSVGKHCFKFGFDSRENLPYIQFPADIATIIEDGLKIKYLRTNGINGNVSAKVLNKLEKPLSWAALENNNDGTAGADYLDPTNYIVANAGASRNGCNPESLTDAYNNYKKTIGTFDTLVTCRDYMNKIYQLTTGDAENTNLVSNIIVSDIRDDINKAFTLCSFGKDGIEYRTTGRQQHFVGEWVTRIVWDAASPAQKASYAGIKIGQNDWSTLVAEGSSTAEEYFNVLFKVYGETESNIKGYYRGIFDGNAYGYAEVSDTVIDHFDLIFYPFKNTYGLNTKNEYIKSFKYDDSNIQEITEALKETKTISHNIILPDGDELACIKNYFNLNAKVTTTRKVNAIEQADILGKIYSSLYANFNMHKLDFGEEIPYDSILKVMEEADPRIKSINLEDPQLETKFCTVAGGEYSATNVDTVSSDTLVQRGNAYYNKLVLNNVLAGRIPLFNYDESFTPNYNESNYPAWDGGSYDLLYPTDFTGNNGITKIKTEYRINTNSDNHDGVKLNDNEIIQFRLPNLRTVKTYPAYVNYFIKLNTEAATPAIPATMFSLATFLEQDIGESSTIHKRWEDAANSTNLVAKVEPLNHTITTDSDFNAEKTTHLALFKLEENTYKYCAARDTTVQNYYYLPLSRDTFGNWDAWVKSVDAEYNDPITGNPAKLNGLYYGKPVDLTNNYGYLIDKNHRQFLAATTFRAEAHPFNSYYVQETHEADNPPSTVVAPEDSWKANGLGQNAVFSGISRNEEYRLKAGEYLLINYTSSASSDTDQKTVVNEIYKGSEGAIIKPNFELVDSLSYRTLHGYSKTSGFDFSDDTDIDQPQGMFTLGTDQQIEIRKFVQVKLNNAQTNIYWERNDEVVGFNDRIVFEFDEEPIYIENGNAVLGDTTFDPTTMIYSAYTLKDGEYFYYTNKDKTDIAYYGAGTKIKRTPYTPKIFKSSRDATISTEEIVTNGLSSAIPWRAYNFSDVSDTIKKGLTLIEYQYKNLVKDNILYGVSDVPDMAGTAPTTIDIDINNTWKSCKRAYFEIDGATEQLPAVNLNASNNENNITWEVRSRLELNVGPDKIQQLYADTGRYSDHITLIRDNTTLEDLTPQATSGILAIKCNKTIQSSRTETDTTTVIYSETGGIATIYKDCQIKVFNLQNVTDAENKTINIGNYGDGNFTKLSCNQMADTHQGLAYATLNALVPGYRTGLIMFNDIRLDTSSTGAAIRFIKASGTDNWPNAPKIYNYNDSWWQEEAIPRALWAVEDKVFNPGELEDTFTTLKAHLYIRNLEDTPTSLPTPESLKRYDYINDKYYSYTAVSENDEYDSELTYCLLLDEGVTPPEQGEEAPQSALVYRLKPGINVVQVDSACKIEILPDNLYSDNIIVGNLNIIYNGEDGINPKLKYKLVDEATLDAQILKDINNLDTEHQFYYNAIMSNDTMIDLNSIDPDDTLENPFNWFDYNNINNKFVISEINADYLSIGVTIARGSKLS